MTPRKIAGHAKRRIVWILKHSTAVKAARDRASIALARFRRPRLHKVTFIGVTGSCAKTTTCIFTKAVLLPGDAWKRGSSQEVAEAVLALDPSSPFHVQELSADAPGKIAKTTALLRPKIGIVTVIGGDHYKHYRGPEAIAREKGQLIEALPSAGIAILNADDPYVLAMASRTSARVVTYGRSPSAEVRATSISSNWPKSLSLTATHGDETATITTRFFGEHWTTSVLAAAACGIACGLDLKSCAAAIERVDPLPGRYSAHRTPHGVNFVLDTFKAPYWTIESGLDFVRKANSPRKTMIFGTISDYSGKAGRRYRKLAQDALAVADRVIFVGPGSIYMRNVRRDDLRDRLFTFKTTHAANNFLSEGVRSEELIYIKSSSTDHLERIMLSQLDAVVCWRERCGIKGYCPKCVNYRKPKPPPLGLSQQEPAVEFETAP